MHAFLQWTAWPMETPTPYGTFHLVFFLVGLAASILLAFLLRKSSEKQNRAVLLACGGFLVATEVYKQLFYTMVIGQGSYQWWIFPFQLCSVPMYLCLIAPFLRDGPVRKGMYNFMLAFNLMGGFVAFLEPSGLVHSYWTLTLHAFCWHMVLVFVGLYLGFSGRAGKKLKDFRYAVVCYIGLCVMAFCINLVLRAAVDGCGANMFYVGPEISPIVVFKSIATRYGWYVNAPIYMACCTLGAFLFFLPFPIYQKKHTGESI